MTQLSAQESQVVLRLLFTKGVGPRALDRVLSSTERGEPNLDLLPQLSGSELSTRFQLNPETAQAFLGDHSRAEKVWERLREQGVVILLKGRADYPTRLCSALGRIAPPVLFATGNVDLLRKPAIGFCGSRKTLETGLKITAKCAAMLASRGINVVSGYAHGVDLAAHRSALEAGGVTTIVLAEGILGFRLKSVLKDVWDEHRLLVISTFLPTLPWSARQAMTRNHIICGLSNAMILVQSRDKGGTFEAGKVALDIHLPLFVVDYVQPRDITSGNTYFLERGAVPLRRNPEGHPNLKRLIEAIENAHKAVTCRSGDIGPLFSRTSGN